MRRRLFSASSFLSLSLCVISAVLWVRSFWAYDNFQLVTHWGSGAGRGFTERQFYSAKGCLGLNTLYATHRYQEKIVTFHWQHNDAALFWWRSPRHHLGFGFESGQNRLLVPGHRYRVWDGWVPHWSLVLLTALLPARWIYRRIAHRRRAGLCPR